MVVDRGAPNASPSGRVRAENILLVFWVAYLIGNLFYVFKSGLPQPSDLAMALAVFMSVSGVVARMPVHSSLYLLGASTVVWFAIVNLIWFGMLRDPRFVLSSLYYVYNFAVVAAIVTMFAHLGESFIRTTMAALFVASGIEVVAVLVLGGDMVRGIGTFNNPNQLGYWVLLATTAWIVLKGRSGLNGIDLILFSANGYLVMKSLSKAAISSFYLLIVMAVLFQGFARGWRFPLLVAFCFGVGAVTFQPQTVDKILNEGIVAKVINHFDGALSENDSTAEGRGYDRIWLHPWHLFVGAGEGAFARFTDKSGDKGIEMHSTWGTILFSYGIVGFSLLAACLLAIFRPAPWQHWLYFVPVALYGVTHQGVRFTMLWILFGIIFGMAQHTRSRDRAEHRSPSSWSRPSTNPSPKPALNKY